MYLANKYTQWYHSLINKAINRKLPNDVYTEKHHIIPKSLGGTNKKENLVRLTAREHFISHLLLVRMTSGADKAKMVNAALRLANDGKNRKVNAKLYEHIKKERRKFLSETMCGSDNHFYGKKHSEETRKKMSESRKKWSYSEEHINKFRGRVGPMLGKTHNEVTRIKLSNAAKGRIHSDESKTKTSQSLLKKHLTRSAETREKMRQSKIGIEHPVKECIHCGKIVAVGMYARWHGDKCKVKDKFVCLDPIKQQ